MKRRLLLLSLYLSLYFIGHAAVPTITSFSPMSGGIGTTVTITGTGFSATAANNTVRFGAVRATVSASTTTTVTVKVPAGAGSVIPVSVMVNSLIANSTACVIPVFNMTDSPTLSGFSNYGKTTIGRGNAPRAVAVADFNNDGIPDMATVMTTSQTVGIALGKGDGSFGDVTYITGAGNNPLSIVAADFNNDGNIDLAVGSYYNAIITFFWGNGAGAFTSDNVNNPWVTGNQVSSMAVADFNRDGKLDIVTASKEGNSIGILLNNGSHVFTSSNVTVGTNPSSVSVGDFNEDGYTDIAVANSGSNNVSILLGNGAGSFSTAVNYAVGTNPSAIVALDFNGDYREDIAVANYGSNTVSILTGNLASGWLTKGDGTFATPVNYPVGTSPTSIAAGDLNGDGQPDIITADYGSNLSYLQNNGGGFNAVTHISEGTLPRCVTVGDFNRDGKADLAVACDYDDFVLINDVTPFGITTQAVSNINSATATANFNISALGSATPTQYGVVWSATTGPTIDLTTKTALGVPSVGTFTSNITGLTPKTTYYARAYVSTVLGTTYGNEVSFTTLPSPIITSFAPASGPIGTTVTITGSNFSSIPANNIVVFGAVKATVTAATNTSITVTVPASSGSIVPVSVAVAGYVAYSVTSTTPTFNVTNTPTLPLAYKSSILGQVGEMPFLSRIADLNGDGIPDIVSVSLSQGNISVSLGKADGTYATAVTYTVIGYVRDLEVGDFNHDNIPDIALCRDLSNDNDYEIAILIGKGDGTFGTGNTTKIPSLPKSVAVGDFNGDGKPDLAVIDMINTDIYLGNGDGTFTAGSKLTVADYADHVEIADMNNDGKADIVVNALNNSNTTYKLATFLGNGNGTFAAPVYSTIYNYAGSFAIGDLNGDGKLDAAILSSDEASLERALGNGNGTFATPSVYVLNGIPTSVAIGDMNGDHNADIIASTVTVDTSTSTVIAGGITILQGFGNGTFTFYNQNTTKIPYSVAIGDINKDGRADVITTTLAGTPPASTTIAMTGNGYIEALIYKGVANVTTQAVTSISTTTATGNGNITDLGSSNPTQYGIVWSTAANPTVALTTKTQQGAVTATGAFSSSITGLTSNTTYYVRTYATNALGTSYGSEVSFTTAKQALSITAPQITLSKAYDGNNAAVVVQGSLSGVDPADIPNLTLLATATYDNLNVGTGKTITVHYTLSGSAATKYSVPTDYVTNTGVITQKGLTITDPTITLSKVYDGNNIAIGHTGTLSGAIGSDADNIILSTTITYNNANAGTGKAITAHYSISGSGATKYTAPIDFTVTSGEITPIALTATNPTLTLSKIYDGTAGAAVIPGNLSGVLTADQINVVLAATAAYDNANAGTSKTITAHYTLSGSAVANYTAPADYSGALGEITPIALTASDPSITLSKVYDGSNTATVTQGILSSVLTADKDNVSLVASATYDNTNVGKNKTITVKYTFSGAAGANYSAPADYSVTSGEITPLALTASDPNLTLSKVYDGNNSVVVTPGTLSGVLTADLPNVFLTAAATYAYANTGTDKTITTHYTLTGSVASNYTAPDDYMVSNGEITTKQLLWSAAIPTITKSKVYDGTTTATIINPGMLMGILPADASDVTIAITANYDDSNVGTNKYIFAHATLNGLAAGNYLAPSNYVFGDGEITPYANPGTKALTMTDPILSNKFYDATTVATVIAGTLQGVDIADAGNVTVSATANFDNANAGKKKNITVHYTLSGSAAAKYTAPTDYISNYNLTIAPKQLLFSDPIIIRSKVYDDTNFAVLKTGTFSGVESVDEANVLLSSTSTYDNENAGTGKTITVHHTLSGSAAGNYVTPVDYIVHNGEITGKPVSNSIPTITKSKVYDGTKVATVIDPGTLSDVLPDDANNVTVSVKANYDDQNVGINKIIRVSFTLSGSAAGNYLAPGSYPLGGGEIISYSNPGTTGLMMSNPIVPLKIYDGTKVANLTAGTLQGVDAADADNVAVSTTANFDNANVGTGKTVTVHYVLTGPAAAKYTAPSDYIVVNAVIRAKLLTASNPTLTLSKMYDGTNSATVTAGTLSGVESVDQGNVSLLATATYNNENVGTDKTITVHYTLSGSAAGNYTAPDAYSVSTGEITPIINPIPVQLTITNSVITSNKEYDGTVAASVSAGTLSGVSIADNNFVTVNATATYDNANAGAGKTITVHYTLSGLAAANYTALADYTISTGVITFKALTASNPTITLSKLYDGNDMAGVTPGILSGVIAADASNVYLGAGGRYDNANVATGKTITVTYTLVGSAAANYTAPAYYSAGTGEITPKALTASDPTITLSKLYDGNDMAGVTPGILSGVIAADASNVYLGADGRYDNANVATGKTITVTYTLVGSAAANYTAPAYYSASTGEITPKSLTASDPTITLSKLYDGNDMAGVTPGILSGVIAADASNVYLGAGARYNNANVAIGKTITAHYTLSGLAAANYTAPADYSVTNGEITQNNISLNPLADPSVGCENSNMELAYNVLTGVASQYKITFSNAALTAGMQDVAYTVLPVPTRGTLFFAIPKGMIAGTYEGTLQLRDDNGFESPAYKFQFSINLSSDFIIPKFDDVVTFDNSSKRFTSYQWYKDGLAITDATDQYYNDPIGLVGTYFVKVTTTDGQTLFTCPKVLNTPLKKKVSAYPNPVKSNQTCTIEVTGYNDQELEGAILSVNDIQGICVYKSTKVEKLNSLSLPAIPQVYIGHVKMTSGADYVFKVIVQK